MKRISLRNWPLEVRDAPEDYNQANRRRLREALVAMQSDNGNRTRGLEQLWEVLVGPYVPVSLITQASTDQRERFFSNALLHRLCAIARSCDQEGRLLQ